MSPFFFTFHGSRYFTFLLVYWFIVSHCLVSVPLYLFTSTTKIEQSSFFQGVCSSFYRNMHLVQVKCMFLELCAHCIHGNNVHVCRVLQFVMQNLPVC